MKLGPYSTYPLPAPVRTAFGVSTAQELADQLGAQGELTPHLAREAETAYNAYRAGDIAAAHEFLTAKLGLTDAVASSALDKLR
ncbi:MAG: hypothetical protein ABWY54_07625 [Glaciihabitans sp.]